MERGTHRKTELQCTLAYRREPVTTLFFDIKKFQDLDFRSKSLNLFLQDIQPSIVPYQAVKG